MKKIAHTPKQQARRTRALARFTIDPERLDDAEYVARKEQERTALKAHLGAQA
jgi:hypothetical protein